MSNKKKILKSKKRVRIQTLINKSIVKEALENNVDKVHLEKLISKMEKQLVHGGDAIEDDQKEDARKIRAMQLEIKKQRK